MRYAENVTTGGVLKENADSSFRRLMTDYYAPETLIRDGDYGWPGDFEGRTLLALLSHAKITGEIHENVYKIIEYVKSGVNRDGYFGEPFDGIAVNEQQLSGNSWFFRALCSYYRLTGDEFALDTMKKATENYLLRLPKFIDDYPVEPSARTNEIKGEAIGALYENAVNGWQLSTDTGCVFISLDGITDIYDITRDVRLKSLIEQMIDKFVHIDKVGLKCQTHATLSATRGILRYYRICGEKKYLDYAEEIYEAYKRDGMTANYANYNWFRCPEWTEPCAVVDSLTVASRLYCHTGKSVYAQDVNRIYINALRFAQRNNGGFGCDSCLTEENEILETNKTFYEAYWCCTMRGAEGIYELSRAQYLEGGNNEIYIPLYNTNRAKLFGGKVEVSQNAAYPWRSGAVTFTVHKNDLGELTIFFYVPQDSVSVTINGVEKTPHDGFAELRGVTTGEYIVEIRTAPKKYGYKNKAVYYSGDMLLCEPAADEPSVGLLQKAAEQNLVFDFDGRKLIPVPNMREIDAADAVNIRLRCVFG